MAGLDATAIQQVTGMVQGIALKIVGGIPILKNIKGSTNELLKLPKHLDVGNVGPLLKMVMQNGIGGVMQNPLAAAAAVAGGNLSGAISAVSALGSAGAGLATALGSLQSSVSAATALAGSLSGAAPGAGLPTNLDLIAHAGMAAGLGTDLPAAMSIATAAAPLLMAPDLASAGTQAAAIASQVVAGTMTPAAAVAAVSAIQAGIDGTVSGAAAAINGLAALAPDLATASTAVACLVPGAVPPELAVAMHGCFQPAALAQAAQIAAAHFAEVTSPDP